MGSVPAARAVELGARRGVEMCGGVWRPVEATTDMDTVTMAIEKVASIMGALVVKYRMRSDPQGMIVTGMMTPLAKLVIQWEIRKMRSLILRRKKTRTGLLIKFKILQIKNPMRERDG